MWLELLGSFQIGKTVLLRTVMYSLGITGGTAVGSFLTDVVFEYICVYMCVCVCVCVYIFKQQSLSSNEISGEFRYRTDKLLDRLQRVGGPPPLKAPGPPGTKAQLEN